MSEIIRINSGSSPDDTRRRLGQCSPYGRYRVRLSYSCLYVCVCSCVSMVLLSGLPRPGVWPLPLPLDTAPVQSRVHFHTKWAETCQMRPDACKTSISAMWRAPANGQYRVKPCRGRSCFDTCHASLYRYSGVWELLLLVFDFDTPISTALVPLYSCRLSCTCFTAVTFNAPDQLLSNDLFDIEWIRPSTFS
jgi:hypothetical protein